MGSGGALGSTGFRNQLGREGSKLHEAIAALRGGMQQQGVGQQLGYAQQPFSNLQSLYGTALQPTQNQYQPANSGVGALAGPLFGGAASYWGAGGGQGGGGQNNPMQGGGQNAGMWGANAARFAGQNPSTY